MGLAESAVAYDEETGDATAHRAPDIDPVSYTHLDVYKRQVLRGSEGERIQQFGHDQLSTYGIGKDLDAKTWRSVFRQLVASGLLEVDTDAYNGLRLTCLLYTSRCV